MLIIQFRSVAQSCLTPCDPMDCSTPGFPVPLYLPEFAKFMSTETMMLSNHLILCTFLSFCLQSFPESGSFPMSWVCIRWPKYQRFSISPSSEYSRLVSFRIDWFDLLAVHRTLESLLQHYSLKASVLWSSAFFMVQLSHTYMTTGKTIALTIWTCVDKVMSLFFNMLSRFVCRASLVA